MEHEFLEGGGQGGTMIYLVLYTTMLIVDKNSIKYGLPTKIIAQERYIQGYEKLMPVDWLLALHNPLSIIWRGEMAGEKKMMEVVCVVVFVMCHFRCDACTSWCEKSANWQK
jgi:hypothetical protein